LPDFDHEFIVSFGIRKSKGNLQAPEAVIDNRERLTDNGRKYNDYLKGLPMATRQVVIDIPEKILLAEKADEIGFSRELRMLAAVKLYELGRLSSGRAAELADMTRVEFLLNLNRYCVFPFASELANMERGVST
jgi:predicted HTH domain antitoxin